MARYFGDYNLEMLTIYSIRHGTDNITHEKYHKLLIKVIRHLSIDCPAVEYKLKGNLNQ